MARKSWRVPLGFLAGVIYIWRADPTVRSLLIGAVFMAAGEAVRFASSGSLKKFEGVARRGFYAYTRNPLYIGSFLIGIGACIMGRDLLFAVLFLVLFPLLYLRVVNREETHLVKMYGDDYLRYKAEVPRIIPRRLNLVRAFTETESARAVKNYEHHTVIGVIAVWGIMLAKLLAG